MASTVSRISAFAFLSLWLAPVAAAQVVWTQAGGGAPSARTGHGVAYDAARDRVVLFGGTSSSGGVLDDTWEWDGTTWTRMSPAERPEARSFHRMVYDAARQQVVLFGGSTPAHPPFFDVHNDTWGWDGTSWTELTPSVSPPVRSRHAMVYDSDRQRVVLFGGGGQLYPTTSPLSDTWEWDGDAWTQVTPATSPPRRADAGIAYDAARRRTVLFGGQSSTIRGDTWLWDGSSWTNATPATGPVPLTGSMMAYDAARERVVMFGGWDGQLFGPLSDETWEWTGSRWLQRSPSASPPGRQFGGLVYDAARQSLVLFGGGGAFAAAIADTWEYAPTVRGQAVTVGTGCGGPQIEGVGAPVVGNLSFSLRVTGAPAGGPVFVGLSAAAGSVPFGSCTVYPQLPFPIVLAANADATGTAVFAKPIAFRPQWSGIELHHQAIVPVTGGPLLGVVALSPGLLVVIGD